MMSGGDFWREGVGAVEGGEGRRVIRSERMMCGGSVKKFFKSAFLFDLFLWGKSNSMTDKEYQWMMDVANKSLERAKHATKEEALADLMRCGLLDKDGNFTEPYKHLAMAIKEIKPS